MTAIRAEKITVFFDKIKHTLKKCNIYINIFQKSFFRFPTVFLFLECVCQLPTLFNLTDAFTMGNGRITQIGDLLGCPSYAYTCSCAQTAINCRTVTVAAISETGELTVYPLTSTTPAEVAIQLTCESGSTWTVNHNLIGIVNNKNIRSLICIGSQ